MPVSKIRELFRLFFSGKGRCNEKDLPVNRLSFQGVFMKKKTTHLMVFIAAMVFAFPGLGLAAENFDVSNPGQNPSPQAQSLQEDPKGFSDPATGIPQLSIKAGRYEFGSVVEGTFVIHEFMVSNSGNAPLTIEKVKTS
ncbi:MAG: DUF1573 domain-containing protein [Desulfobacteraceae bacterium]|nr:DUF1573 domain-containing protein [Desulfobacteraceae bacterium]